MDCVPDYREPDFDRACRLFHRRRESSRSPAGRYEGLCCCRMGRHCLQSSVGSTVLYPPTPHLRAVQIDGTGDRQITSASLVCRSGHIVTGGLFASSVRISRCVEVPVSGSP